MEINKTHKILILFTAYCLLSYLAMNFIVQRIIDKNSTSDQDLIESILKSLYIAVMGIVYYLTLINLTSITGLLISLKLKDTFAIKAFKITTSLSISMTILYLLAIQLGLL